MVVHVYSATAEMWSMRETIVHLHSADRARHTMIVKSQCQWTPWVELEGNALRTNGAAVPCQRTAEIMPQMLEKAHASMPVSIARRCALRQLDVTADEPPPVVPSAIRFGHAAFHCTLAGTRYSQLYCLRTNYLYCSSQPVFTNPRSRFHRKKLTRPGHRGHTHTQPDRNQNPRPMRAPSTRTFKREADLGLSAPCRGVRRRSRPQACL